MANKNTILCNEKIVILTSICVITRLKARNTSLPGNETLAY